MVTSKAVIHIESQATPPIIPVVQGDTGRSILFTIADFTIPTGATATYYIQKPSGNAVYNNAVIEGNTITANLTAQSIAEIGDNYGQVRIAKDGEVVTSFDFILLVKEFRGIDATESITEMNIFDKAVQQAEAEINTAKDSAIEEIAASAENIAEEFSAANSYFAGEFVLYGGRLYKFTANHSGAWTGTDAEQLTVGDALGDAGEQITTNTQNITQLQADTNTLKEESNRIESDLDYRPELNLIDVSKITEGYKLANQDGGISVSATWYVTDWIKVDPNTKYTVSGVSSFYRAEVGADKSSYTGLGQNVATFTTGASTKYVRFNSRISGYSTPQLQLGDTATPYEPYKLVPQRIVDLETDLSSTPDYTFVGFRSESIVPIYPEGGKVTFSQNIGYIAKSDGHVVNAGTGTWLYSDFLPIDRIDGNCGDWAFHSMVASVAYYSDADFDTYLGNYSVDQTYYTKAEILANAPSGANYIIICTDGSRKELYATLTAVSAKPEMTITNIPVFGNRYMHISFDDTNKAFADLTANAGAYASIFDSGFFGCLKDLHDKYGCVFSCYCFYNVYTDDTKATLTFSLANATTAFKSEFEENADWLKFGFHSIDNYTYYGSASADDAKADWNTFINTMLDVVGLKCIDTLVRVHGFTGGVNACTGMRNALCGARGFLCSDYSETGSDKNIDTSTGYYLTNAQATVCGRMGEFFDATNSLYFYPSNLRLDNIIQANLLAYLELFNTADRFNRSRYMIMYCHENQMTANAGTIGIYKQKLETVLKWANENKYVFAYPEDLVTK